MDKKSNNISQNIDLHVHSHSSDGSLSSVEIIREAAQLGLRAVAITDHDTIAGLAEGMKEAEIKKIEFVPGVELSLNYSFQPFHLLGYYIDPNNKALNIELNRLSRIRMQLLSETFKRLRHIGINITPKQVIETQHLLNLSNIIKHLRATNTEINKNKIVNIYESLKNEWKNNLLSPREGISLIHQCGGVAILAHPKLANIEDEKLYEIIMNLQKNGLDGLECIHPEHTINDRIKYTDWANRLGLLCTGGSDYHGKYKSGIRLGVGAGDLQIPYTILEKIKLYKG